MPRSSLPYVLPNCAKNHHPRVPLPEASPSQTKANTSRPTHGLVFLLQMLCTVLLNGNLRPCPKMSSHPAPELRGIQLPRVQPAPCSLPVPWLYVAWRTHGPCRHHTQAYPGQEERGLPLPTNLLNPVSSEHP